MLSIKRILAPIDFSDCSDHALTYAVELAEKFAADLVLVYVVPDFSTWIPDTMMPLPTAGPDMNDVLKSAQETVEKLIADQGLARLNAKADIRVGAAATEIVEAAKDGKADMIVIGTHGRSGFSHLVLGSVAERVLRAAPCPVLSVRGPA